MPCRCDDFEPRARFDAADRATRAACDMRTILRRYDLEKELTAETREWIAKHDAEDEARIKEEKEISRRESARRRGLEKLTLEERRALGL